MSRYSEKAAQRCNIYIPQNIIYWETSGRHITCISHLNIYIPIHKIHVVHGCNICTNKTETHVCSYM